MRKAVVVASAVIALGGGCTTSPSPAPAPPPEPVPTPVVIPTVPPATPVPAGGAALPTRPVGDDRATEAARRAGKAVGPVVTYAGIARADGKKIDAAGKTSGGLPIYTHPVGAGFMIVVEGKPGISNIEVARSIFRYDEADPSQLPDLQIQVTRPLGDGSAAVCDARRPNIGGIPAINPPSFAETPKNSAAMNDFACRFETFIESNASCTVNQYGDFEFFSTESKVQYCMVVARSWNFPAGDTQVSVRLRDVDGNVGPVSRFVLRYKPNPTPRAKATPVPTPTAPRRRE